MPFCGNAQAQIDSQCFWQRSLHVITSCLTAWYQSTRSSCKKLRLSTRLHISCSFQMMCRTFGRRVVSATSRVARTAKTSSPRTSSDGSGPPTGKSWRRLTRYVKQNTMQFFFLKRASKSQVKRYTNSQTGSQPCYSESGQNLFHWNSIITS